MAYGSGCMVHGPSGQQGQDSQGTGINERVYSVPFVHLIVHS